MKPVSLEATMMKRIGELNAEASALRAQVARLNHEVLHLKSDVERLVNNNKYLDQKLDEELDGKEKA